MADRGAILFFVAAYTSCIAAVYSQGYSGQPSALLSSRNDLLHGYDLNRLSIRPKVNRKGPVLFPNDAPPPPRPPLIVTSRPLIEQLARSELNPNPPESNITSEQSQINKNSIAEQSQINRVQINQPNFLARIKQYTPISFPTAAPPTAVVLVDAVTGRPLYSGSFREHQASSGSVDYSEYGGPYTGFAKHNQDVRARGEREYKIDDNTDSEERQPTLPPIYKALSDHAQKALKLNQEKKMSDIYNGFEEKQTNTADQNYLNKLHNEGRITSSGEYTQGKNYAFSYSVKDQKSGDDFSHRQRTSGAATNGEYRVRLPDGRMQIVSYVADENGYQADVRYDEETGKTAGNALEETIYNADLNENRAGSEEYYPDQSKNYYNDDYSDYMNRGDDVQRKFAAFDAQATPKPIVVVPQNSYKSSTVTPSYDVLKALFVTKKPHSFYRNTPFQINVPSTTSNPYAYQSTTERVVVIGTPKSRLYTNIRNTIPNYSPTPSYVPSSTANPVLIRNVNMSNNKAILSGSYINRINRYLSFT